ncbi:MAG: glycosyltransferase family 2 protein [Desulfobacca sp.]|nr:glycosyltransferase family 2 protein [Desulfobacca sp.]
MLIIPAYNEAKDLQVLLPKVKARYPEMPVLVVDDGSQDQTRAIAQAQQVAVVSHPFNLGYGAAIQTGYKYALEKQCPYVVQMDADGQHEVEDVALLVQPVKQGLCDLALGSRFLNDASYRPAWPRRVGIRFFRGITKLITGQPITDPTSGFQAMNRRVLQIFTGRHFPDDYPDADVLVMLNFYGITIQEIPVRMYASTTRSMHHGWWRPFFYMAKMCFSLLITCSLKGHFRRRRSSV